jgi:hypothetical protein
MSPRCIYTGRGLMILFRLWLLLRARNSRKQNEHMRNKPSCTPKLRRHHRTLSLPMPQHPRHIQLQEQEQELHNHLTSHGGLKSCFFSVVHLHHMSMVINTASVVAFRFTFILHLYCFHYFPHHLFPRRKTCAYALNLIKKNCCR